MPPPLNIYLISVHPYKYEGENLLIQIFYQKNVKN